MYILIQCRFKWRTIWGDPSNLWFRHYSVLRQTASLHSRKKTFGLGVWAVVPIWTMTEDGRMMWELKSAHLMSENATVVAGQGKIISGLHLGHPTLICFASEHGSTHFKHQIQKTEFGNCQLLKRTFFRDCTRVSLCKHFKKKHNMRLRGRGYVTLKTYWYISRQAFVEHCPLHQT